MKWIIWFIKKLFFNLIKKERKEKKKLINFDFFFKKKKYKINFLKLVDQMTFVVKIMVIVN